MNNLKDTRYKKVLIIEDDEMDLYITQKVIKAEQFAGEVVSKTTVPDALQYLNSLIHDRGHLPEIIFLDLNIPGADGFDFLDAIAIVGAQSKINFRIVILTNVLGSYKNGLGKTTNYPMVEAILEKPLTPEALKKI